MKLLSLFAGAGGLDLGFQNAGFNIVLANEYDKTIWDTYKFNHPNTILNTEDIRKLNIHNLPNVDGVIGGPPCQSWSIAGARKGIEDKRGQLFFDYIKIISEKNPLFFVAENVAGMLNDKHQDVMKKIMDDLSQAGMYGYNLSFKLLNAADFGIPQERKRIFFIGYRKDIDKVFSFNSIDKYRKKILLQDVIYDLRNNLDDIHILNHEYMTGGFSTIYMSRNRVRSWDEVSFTIQAGGRHAPIHPDAPKMIKIEKDKMIFVPNKEHLYRRLTVRECARIQTFPDNFKFIYKNIADGYKMVGNAVPVKLAQIIATEIKKDLLNINNIKNNKKLETKQSISQQAVG
jgi:DNA (cytosine-5)-methyltransferase 1